MKMCSIHLTFACLIVVGFVSSIQGSHFRGGTISWEHLQSNGTLHQIRFSFRLGWRRQNLCDANRVNGDALYPDGSWVLDSRAISSEFPQSTAIVCTSYDIGEDWAYGFNSFVADVHANGSFSASFSSGNWIAGLAFGSSSSWSVALIDIDLDERSDTGKTNRPPTTLSAPVIRLQLGCRFSIRINVHDADNDPITCRYAVGFTECGGVCGSYQHFILNQTTCTIDYNGGGGAFIVPVALMLEDHPRQNIVLGGNRNISTSDALSKVPLQILVKIEQSSKACNQVPTYPPSSIQQGSAITLAESRSLNETLYAYPSAPNLTITQFVIIGPVGMESTPVYIVGNGMYATNITWQPDKSQGGNHIVCYYAVDSSNAQGEQICFTVFVTTASNPCDVDNGGCSDICIPQGTSMSCICSEPCWELAFDEKTCAPAMNVTCSGVDVDIYVKQCATSHAFVVENVFGSFNGNRCQSSERGSSHHLNFSPSDCNSIIQSKPFFVEYNFKLWAWKGITYEGSTDAVTRGIWKLISITCSLPTSGNFSGSFVPVLPFDDEFFPDEVTIDGIGSFEMFFEFYKTSSFGTAFAPQDYPIEVTVNDDMYFTLGAVGRGGLVFFTQSCVAMSNKTLDTSDLYYYFISDGCLLDPTLVRYNSSNSMENRFSIKAFVFERRLLATRKTSDIHIKCKVMLCDASDNSNRCFQGCLQSNGRRKRSLKTIQSPRSRKTQSGIERRDNDDDEENVPLLITVSPPQDVSSRFVLVVETVDEITEGPGGSEPSYTMWILIGCAVGLLALGAFIACHIVKKKRSAQKSEFIMENGHFTTLD